MFSRRTTLALLVLCVAFSTRSAQAFIDPPWITPARPTAGEIVSVNIRGGACDAILEQPGFPQITQAGNSIRIILYGVHYDFEDFFIFPIGTTAFPIAGYPEGTYTLQVDFAYDDYLLGPTITNLGCRAFTVMGAPTAATSVPTISPVALLILSLALWLTAWLWRMRQTSN